MTSDLPRLSSYRKLRTYLMICAYNTGVGNVSRAFIGKSRLSEPFSKINSFSPNEGFKHLVRNLPYEENPALPGACEQTNGIVQVTRGASNKLKQATSFKV